MPRSTFESKAAPGRHFVMPPSNWTQTASTEIIDSPSSIDVRPTTTTAAYAPRAARTAAGMSPTGAVRTRRVPSLARSPSTMVTNDLG